MRRHFSYSNRIIMMRRHDEKVKMKFANFLMLTFFYYDYLENKLKKTKNFIRWDDLHANTVLMLNFLTFLFMDFVTWKVTTTGRKSRNLTRCSCWVGDVIMRQTANATVLALIKLFAISFLSRATWTLSEMQLKLFRF